MCIYIPLLPPVTKQEVTLIPLKPSFIVSVDPTHPHHLKNTNSPVVPSPSNLVPSFSHRQTSSKIYAHISSNSFTYQYISDKGSHKSKCIL